MIQCYRNEDFIDNGIMLAARKEFCNIAGTHSHDFFEIEYVISGSGSYIINGQNYPMKPGMLYFMTPADVHAVVCDKVDIINVMFMETSAEPEFISHMMENNNAAVFLLKDEEKQYFEGLLMELVRNTEDKEYSMLLLSCILAKLVKKFGSSIAGNPQTSISKRSMLHILKHFRKPITVGDIAEGIGVTASYLSDSFKQETGMNIKKYLNAMRLNYARKLLLFSDMTVLEICRESGFESYENFIRRFKSVYGNSPIKYKKLSCLKREENEC